MRRLLKWLAAALLLPPLLLAAAILLALETQPLVERGDVISPLSIAQARHLFSRHDPRHRASGEIASVAIPANLIDEGINYVAGRYLHGRGAFALNEGGGELRFSLPVIGQRYLNFSAAIAPSIGMPHIAHARLGGLPLPGPVVDTLIAGILSACGFGREWRMANQAIREVAFDAASNTVTLTYQWEPLILDRARAIALSPEEIERLHKAQLSLAALLSHRAPGSVVGLAEILNAVLPQAGDAGGHGRAVLLVLASRLAGIDLAALVPAAKAWPRIRWVRVTLAGRHDLAQHFVVSAALAAWSGEPVADAIGLYKELDDARRGSGFSFIDLAADRAGTRFGETLVKRPAWLNEKVSGELRDGDLLPAVGDLPEYLNAEQFGKRFDSPGSPQFKAMAREIESRLDALPLYR